MPISQPLRQQMTQLPQYQMAQALMQQGASTAPVRSPLEGIARALTGAVGGYSASNIRKDFEGRDAGRKQAITQALMAAQGGNNDAMMAILGSNPETADMALSAQLQKAAKGPNLHFMEDPAGTGHILAIDKNNPMNNGILPRGGVSGDALPAPSSGGASSPTMSPKTAQLYNEMLAKAEADKLINQPKVKGGLQAAIASTDNVNRAIDRARDLGDRSDEFLPDVLPSSTTGFVGSMLSYVPGTGSHNLKKTLDTVKANIGFDRLQQMRDNSPTGGALGQVSELELALLQSTIASLEQSQSEEQFLKNLDAVGEQYTKTIDRMKEAYKQDYGTLEGFESLVDTEGKEDEQSSPMEGAQQAPDGKWYIQQNGQWFEVTQ